MGPEGEVKPASSSLYLPLLPTCLPKEQSKSRDQQHNHNSLYDAWQEVSLQPVHVNHFPHTERTKKVGKTQLVIPIAKGRYIERRWRSLRKEEGVRQYHSFTQVPSSCLMPGMLRGASQGHTVGRLKATKIFQPERWQCHRSLYLVHWSSRRASQEVMQKLSLEREIESLPDIETWHSFPRSGNGCFHFHLFVP